MTSSGRSYAGASYADFMSIVAFVVSLAAGIYLLYAMVRPERF
jgi:K+-transporting ATPase KdpF subunit